MPRQRLQEPGHRLPVPPGPTLLPRAELSSGSSDPLVAFLTYYSIPHFPHFRVFYCPAPCSTFPQEPCLSALSVYSGASLLSVIRQEASRPTHHSVRPPVSHLPPQQTTTLVPSAEHGA